MQTINYLIIDDDVNGRVKCSIDESTIIAYRISRKHLAGGVDEFDRENWTKKSGIYLLITKNTGDKPSVYIGQANQRKNGDGFIARLSEHLKDANKGDWSEAVLLTVKDEYSIPLNALEHRFWKDALDNKRCYLNQTEPANNKVTDERRGFFDNFIKYGEFFVGILGHKIYEPISKKKKEENQSTEKPEEQIIKKEFDDKIFKLTFKKGTLAYGKRTDEGFVVLKGAKISNYRTSKKPNAELREQTMKLYEKIEAIRSEKEYAIDKTKWETTEDLLFASANEAGGFVSYGLAKYVNYWIENKPNGRTLAEVQKEEAEILSKD